MLYGRYMKYKDYYAVLGVASDATLEQIKKAYRLLAKAHHPDMSKEVGAEERFKDAAEAYACLKNPEKRAAYDALGKVPEDEGFSPPAGWGSTYAHGQTSFEDMDLADLLASLSAHSKGTSAHSQPLPGRDLKDTVHISMLDSLLGCKMTFLIKGGHAEKHIEVSIPAGVRQGQSIRLRGMGGEGRRGGPPGDMYLNVDLLSHPMFKRIGEDLYFNLAVTPWEAVLGAEIEVPTLQSPVILSLPAGTQNAQKLRIKGRGLPGTNLQRGDLFAVIHLEIPSNVTDEERHLYQSLAKASSFNPRHT